MNEETMNTNNNKQWLNKSKKVFNGTVKVLSLGVN